MVLAAASGRWEPTGDGLGRLPSVCGSVRGFAAVPLSRAESSWLAVMMLAALALDSFFSSRVLVFLFAVDIFRL